MTNSLPLISVIIATRNAAKDIDILLSSIASQSLKEYEVIVVDGLSTDNTVEVTNRFISSFALNVISEADSGIYDAMNKGIALAKGKWLIFMGADDQFYDHFVFRDFARLLTESANENIDLVFGNFVFRGRVFKSRLDWRLFFTNPVNHQSVFYNRAVFDNCNYDPAYKYAADYNLNLKLYLRNAEYLYFDRIVSIFMDSGVSTRYREYSNYEMQMVRVKTMGVFFASLIEFLRRIRKIGIRLKETLY